MHNIHPVYHVKSQMIMKELAKHPELKVRTSLPRTDPPVRRARVRGRALARE